MPLKSNKLKLNIHIINICFSCEIAPYYSCKNVNGVGDPGHFFTVRLRPEVYVAQ